MSEIRTGNLLIRTKEESVEFEFIGKGFACVDVACSELPELLGFFNSYLRMQSNRRTGFRINLSQIKSHLADRLCVTVAMRQGQVTAKPIDLSLTGICVESSYHFGRSGATVDIILNYGQHHAVLPAIVVRHEGAVDHTAFHFVDSINDGEADPTPELEFIFRELESLWLDQCLQLEWAGAAEL